MESLDLLKSQLPALTEQQLEELADLIDEMRWEAKFQRDQPFWQKRALEVEKEHLSGKTGSMPCD